VYRLYRLCRGSSPANTAEQSAVGKEHPKEVQLSFMKFTAQMIIKDLRNSRKRCLLLKAKRSLAIAESLGRRRQRDKRIKDLTKPDLNFILFYLNN
jgi:hypothetical protein